MILNSTAEARKSKNLSRLPKQKEVSLDEAVALAKGLVENGMAINDAAKEIAKETKLKKGDIYKALLGE